MPPAKGGWAALHDAQEKRRQGRAEGPPLAVVPNTVPAVDPNQDRQPPQSSQPQESRQLPETSQLLEQPAVSYGSGQPYRGSQPDKSTQPPQSGQTQESSQPPQSRQLQQSSQLSPNNLMASLPEVRGHTEVPHVITDHLDRLLDVYEQAVFRHLYRLSWGFGTQFCRISNPRLADRTSMSEAQVKKTVTKLVAKGLLRKTGNVQGYGKDQGVEYEVAAPKWQLQRSSQPRSTGQRQQSSQTQQSTIKEEVLKETDKGNAALCPDCFGSGWWYPQGTAMGARPGCTHPRLAAVLAERHK